MTTETRKKQPMKLEERAVISQVVREILEDPDFGLELTEIAKRRLRKSAESKNKKKSAVEIKEKYY